MNWQNINLGHILLKAWFFSLHFMDELKKIPKMFNNLKLDLILFKVWVLFDDRKACIYFSFTLVYALAINMSTAQQEVLAESIQSDKSFKICKLKDKQTNGVNKQTSAVNK